MVVWFLLCILTGNGINVGFVELEPYCTKTGGGVGGKIMSKLAGRLGWNIVVKGFDTIENAEGCLQGGDCDLVCVASYDSDYLLSYPIFYVIHI